MPGEIIDQASALETMMRDNAIQAHRLNRDAVSEMFCIDCGDSIPELRRVKVPGCKRCASCQQDEELRMKTRRM